MLKRRRPTMLTARMLSRSCKPGDIVSTHDGHRMIVTERITRDMVACRSLTLWERIRCGWRPVVIAILQAASAGTVLAVLAWCVVQHMMHR